MRALSVIILSIFMSLCLVKSLQAKEYQLTGKNINILLSDNKKGILLWFKNNKNNDAIKTDNLFEINFNSGKKLTEKDFNLQDIKQDKNTITINYIRDTIRVTTILSLCDRANFGRYEIQISAENNPLNMSMVSLMPFKTQAPFVYGSVVSSPIISDSFFVIPENPLTNTIAYEGGVTQKIAQAIPLQPVHTLSYKTYIGIYAAGQLRRNVNQFLNFVRARPYHPYLHYNSWLDIGFFNPYTEKQALLRIKQYGEQLIKKRGVKLNGYLFDDGWDNLTGNWGFGANFPNEFNKLKIAAEKYHAALGIWLSPWGGYNKPRDICVSHAAEFGYEIMDGKLALSGANYYVNFHQRILQLIKQQNITMFKLDGTGNADKVIAGSPFTSDFDAAIHMISDMRKANNNLYINLTTGTQATPSWLFYADSIWRGGDDVNYYGPGTKVKQWLTYRDAETYRSIVMKGPLFPLNSLMLYGIIYAKQAKYLASQSEQDFADQVWSYFATGTQLQEMYITPELLSDNNWQVLASAANWAYENQAILFDSHWIGSDPTKLAIYGWVAWASNKSIISLRNPSDKPQVYYLDLQRDLELPAGTSQSYQVSLNYISQAGSKKPATINQSALVTLSPFETVVMSLVPDSGKQNR